MNIDILTLFPNAVTAYTGVSILGRAQERGYITIRAHQIRQFTTNKQMQVDDYPYGGGPVSYTHLDVYKRQLQSHHVPEAPLVQMGYVYDHARPAHFLHCLPSQGRKAVGRVAAHTGGQGVFLIPGEHALSLIHISATAPSSAPMTPLPTGISLPCS